MKKKHRKQQKMLAALFWTTKNKKFSLVTCDFLDWMTYYWKRKIMSKTIIITIHFPILFIIIISLFTFYLSFIFCAITLINSILKKNYHFSLVSIHLQFLFSHLFKVLLIYDDNRKHKNNPCLTSNKRVIGEQQKQFY